MTQQDHKPTGKTQKTKSKARAITVKSLLIALHTIKWLVVAGIVFGFMAGGVVAGYVTSLVKDEPIRSKDLIFKKMQENAITGFVYFNDDTLVGQLRSDEDRRLIDYSEIPTILLDAFIAIEDNDFETHPGIDVRGTARAAFQKLMKKDVQTGGSTITQQLARRVFLTLDRTDSRKFKEIFLALRLERFMSKPEIITAYLNKIHFGNGSNGYNVYGIKAAAKGIFDKSVDQLNLPQAAYLAGLPQLPSRYSAFTSKGEFDEKGFGLAVDRQRLVLRRMLEEQKITNDEYESALTFDLKATLAKTSQKAYTTYPFLMLEAERKAAEIILLEQNKQWTEQDLRNPDNADLLKVAGEELRQGGYKIYTTIDKTLYDLLQEMARNPENFSPDDEEKGVEQIGGIMIENKTGAILAMMEGRDFYIEQLNHATQMVRQPGSTMKTIAAYVPALELGLIQPATAIDDAPMVLPDGGKGFHIPENWDSQFHGMVTARVALNKSYNIPALRLFNEIVGIEQAWDFVKRMGISTLVEADYHAKTGVIGGLTNGVTVEELTNAFATIANKGIYNDSYMIRKIESADGEIVYERTPNPTQVFSEETAYLATDMMRTVISAGTGTELLNTYKHHKEVPIVGKTGTTQTDTDAWFVGYSPDITVGVWAGYDQPIHKLSSKTGGVQRARRMWPMIMNAAVETKPELFPTKEFEKPDNVIKMTVSNLSGKLPTDLVKESNHLVSDWFNKPFIPKEEDDVLIKTSVIKYNGVNYIAQPSTPPDFIQEKVLMRRAQPTKNNLELIAQMFEKYPNSVPRKRGGARKTPEDYYPNDYAMEAPAEIDPRADDGEVPTAPSNVTLKQEDDKFVIRFTPSEQEDVIGYRLYRSANAAPFAVMSGKVAFTGDESLFADAASLNLMGYYVTAVDVAGNESTPSRVVYSNGFIDSPPTDPLSSGGFQDGGSDPVTGGPSAPTNVKVESREGGIGIRMTWDAGDPDDNVVRYDVYYRADENGSFRHVGYVNGGTKFEYISVPIEGWYRVQAVNAAGASEPSQAVFFEEE